MMVTFSFSEAIKSPSHTLFLLTPLRILTSCVFNTHCTTWLAIFITRWLLYTDDDYHLDYLLLSCYLELQISLLFRNTPDFSKSNYWCFVFFLFKIFSCFFSELLSFDSDSLARSNYILEMKNVLYQQLTLITAMETLKKDSDDMDALTLLVIGT